MSAYPKWGYMVGPNQEALDEFLNTTDEIHPVWYGFCEALGIGAIPALTLAELDNLLEEWHYFLLGLIAGGLVIAGLIGAAAAGTIGLLFRLGDGIVAGLAVAAWVAVVQVLIIAPRTRDKVLEELVAARADLAIHATQYDGPLRFEGLEPPAEGEEVTGE